jgi:prevent-host-death family protein
LPKTIKATDAVRTFSEILNSVKYRHESYTIIRGGKPAAALVPVDTIPVQKTLGDLAEFMRRLPRLGDDVERFMNDVEEAVRKQPVLPERSIWE